MIAQEIIKVSLEYYFLAVGKTTQIFLVLIPYTEFWMNVWNLAITYRMIANTTSCINRRWGGGGGEVVGTSRYLKVKTFSLVEWEHRYWIYVNICEKLENVKSRLIILHWDWPWISNNAPPILQHPKIWLLDCCFSYAMYLPLRAICITVKGFEFIMQPNCIAQQGIC